MKILNVVLNILLRVAKPQATSPSLPNVVVEAASREAAEAIADKIKKDDPAVKAIVTAATPLAVEEIGKLLAKAARR